MERPFLAFLRYEAGWEALWAPYDEATHLTVLEVIRPEDIVLDIGGGDHNLSVAHAALPAIRRETEARWRMGPEVVDLSGFGIPYEQLELGWFARLCGAAGFKPGPAERLTAELLTRNHEVNGCPACQTRKPRHEPVARFSRLYNE